MPMPYAPECFLHERGDPHRMSPLRAQSRLPFEQNLLPVTGITPACTMRSIAYLSRQTNVPPEASATM